MGGNQLAVGCDEGICLWNFVSSPKTPDIKSAWMTWLPSDDHRPVVGELKREDLSSAITIELNECLFGMER